jgi:transcriptional regulator NrdR family protein
VAACPKCRLIKTAVVLTQQLENGWTRRRRVCDLAGHGCGHRWYTLEIAEDDVEERHAPEIESDYEDD